MTRITTHAVRYDEDAPLTQNIWKASGQLTNCEWIPCETNSKELPHKSYFNILEWLTRGRVAVSATFTLVGGGGQNDHAT